MLTQIAYARNLVRTARPRNQESARRTARCGATPGERAARHGPARVQRGSLSARPTGSRISSTGWSNRGASPRMEPVNIHEVTERVRALVNAGNAGEHRGGTRLRSEHSGPGRRPRTPDPGNAEHRTQLGACPGRSWPHRAADLEFNAGSVSERSSIGSCAGSTSPTTDRASPDDLVDGMFYPLVSGRDGGAGPRVVDRAGRSSTSMGGSSSAPAGPATRTFGILLPMDTTE